MRYEFVHKRNNDWSFEEFAVIEKTISFVNEPIAGDPVVTIGKYLAEIVKVKFLIIGQVDSSASEKVSTVCFLQNGELQPNFSFQLKGTPCQDSCFYDICYHPFGVSEEFLNNADLVKMNPESYMGTSLLDKEGNRVGIIALIDEVTILNPGFVEYILIIVLPVLEQHILAGSAKTNSPAEPVLSNS